MPTGVEVGDHRVAAEQLALKTTSLAPCSNEDLRFCEGRPSPSDSAAGEARSRRARCIGSSALEERVDEIVHCMGRPGTPSRLTRRSRNQEGCRGSRPQAPGQALRGPGFSWSPGSGAWSLCHPAQDFSPKGLLGQSLRSSLCSDSVDCSAPESSRHRPSPCLTALGTTCANARAPKLRVKRIESSRRVASPTIRGASRRAPLMAAPSARRRGTLSQAADARRTGSSTRSARTGWRRAPSLRRLLPSAGVDWRTE
jgi:hypothetical protein